MRVAVIGASGKTGTQLVRVSRISCGRAGYLSGSRRIHVAYTLRQRIMRAIGRMIIALTPYSMKDMYKASSLIHEQPEWDWTIVRAPRLSDAPAAGYRLCELSEVTSAHVLSRADYAACMLDTLGNPDHHRRTLTVVPATDAPPH